MYFMANNFTKSLIVKPDNEDFNETFKIRKLAEEDIEQIAKARKAQEIENGNGATDAYLEGYKEILKKLFEQKRIIGVGAFKDNSLVSLACFNLINFGNEKKIPYLCGVWTNPKFRGKKLASKVNNKLMEYAIKRKKELQPMALLTLEGTDAAYNLYKKLGYVNVSGEMSFLGDVKEPTNKGVDCRCSKIDNINKSIVYSINGITTMEIVYSEEQFFAHPANIDGKMSRIVQIKILQDKLNIEKFEILLQSFISKHRFCKFNVNELTRKEKKLYSIFSLKDGDLEGMLECFEEIKLESTDGKFINLKRSNNVMEKSLEKEFDKDDSR